jgi:vitamin B12/bleomycin/antimicrobial peptide transport system ATP-binding/permease protein
LIVAPAFIRGEIDFGAITQSGMAFSSVVAALSLVVTQFQSLSAFAAVIARLSSLTQAIEQPRTSTGAAIEVVEAEGRLAYEGLTLPSSTSAGPLVKDLSITISTGTRVLLTGPNAAAGVALFRATAGLSTAGAGRIIRPGADDLLFLPQRPYLPPGTLRQVLGGASHVGETSDDQILALLRELNLENLTNQRDGLDTEQDWGTLSLREQQLLAFVRILLAAPQFVFLDRIGVTMGLDQAHKFLEMLTERSMAFINSEAADDSRDVYDAILDCRDDGGWIWTEILQPDSEANQRGAKTSS